jgi:ATP-dependent exoDNAse (exonuclease V) beta subunit
MSSVEAGVLVHRALARNVSDIEAVLSDEERAVIADVEEIVSQARQALTELRTHPDVIGVFGDGAPIRWRRHEVPFSLRDGDRVVRGTIDCLVERDTGVIEVLEFKTGRASTDHQQQLATYVNAARAIFPGRVVAGKLVYAR